MTSLLAVDLADPQPLPPLAALVPPLQVVQHLQIRPPPGDLDVLLSRPQQLASKVQPPSVQIRTNRLRSTGFKLISLMPRPHNLDLQKSALLGSDPSPNASNYCLGACLCTYYLLLPPLSPPQSSCWSQQHQEQQPPKEGGGPALTHPLIRYAPTLTLAPRRRSPTPRRTAARLSSRRLPTAVPPSPWRPRRPAPSPAGPVTVPGQLCRGSTEIPRRFPP